jgi:hypothetical protein
VALRFFCVPKCLVQSLFHRNIHIPTNPRIALQPAKPPEVSRFPIPVAPIPVHTPVDAPHSVQNTPHTIAKFLLTLKIEGVKTQSFFGTFKVFPVGAASGAQA